MNYHSPELGNHHDLGTISRRQLLVLGNHSGRISDESFLFCLIVHNLLYREILENPMKRILVGLGLVAGGLMIVSKWLAEQSPVCLKHNISKSPIDGKLRCIKCWEQK